MLVIVRNVKKRDVAKRRKRQQFSLFYLVFVKTFIVLTAGEFYNVVVGIVGLYQRASGFFGASGSAYDLRQQREGALVGAVVVKIKRHIREQYADERNVRKIVTFRHHLRTEQNVSALAKLGEQFVVSVLDRGRVGVHTQYFRVG